MKDRSVLISGPALASDLELRRELSRENTIISNTDNRRLKNAMSEKGIDLLLLEISNDELDDLDMLKIVKSSYPNTPVVILNGGSRYVRVQAFQHGAKDVFRIPYKIAVIAERVNALLDLKQTEP